MAWSEAPEGRAERGAAAGSDWALPGRHDPAGAGMTARGASGGRGSIGHRYRAGRRQRLAGYHGERAAEGYQGTASDRRLRCPVTVCDFAELGIATASMMVLALVAWALVTTAMALRGSSAAK